LGDLLILLGEKRNWATLCHHHVEYATENGKVKFIPALFWFDYSDRAVLSSKTGQSDPVITGG